MTNLLLSLLVVYSSPFTGKTYNLDYEANWSHVTFPPLPPPKAFNWDFNWNFNHGDGSKNVAVNKETTEEPSTTTSKSTTVSSNTGSYSGQHGHKNIDVKWSFDFNHGASATTSASSTEKPIKDENEQVKEEVLSENETILDDDDGGKAQDNDINPTSQ